MERLSKPNNVYEKLKSEILYLELTPGSAISEIHTSQRFHVSRTPVRDAFKRLEIEGLLEIKPHIGSFVSLIDLNHITDILFMREKLEFAIINEISGKIKSSTKEQLITILNLQKQFLREKSSEQQIAKAFFECDNDFHKNIFASADKSGVWDALACIEHHYTRFRMFLNLTDRKTLYRLYLDHCKMLEYIINGEMDNLKPLLFEHIWGGIERGKEKMRENPQYFTSLILS